MKTNLDEHVDEYLVQHDLGFSVLAAPFSPAEADMIAPKDVYKVMGALRKRFDYVVVDTPRPALRGCARSIRSLHESSVHGHAGSSKHSEYASFPEHVGQTPYQ